MAAAISAVLGVETSFKGGMMSSAAVMAMGLEKIAGVFNHNVMLDWMALRKAHSIESTPLSPFLHPSLLAQNNLHINGAGIEGEGWALAKLPFVFPRPSATRPYPSALTLSHTRSRKNPLSHWL